MKTILVTGGAGFIGSHLCEYLLNQGHSVICLDNLCSGSLDNIEYLSGNKNFRYVNHDITYPFQASVDEIYNLACPASPPFYQRDPVKTLTTSVIGAIHMLELATKNNAMILQASTSEVYGDPLIHPQRESYWGHVNPVGLRSCYDEGKRCAESLFMDYHKQYHTKSKIIRIFNTYGPRMRMDDGRVISNFIMQALRNEDITIYGHGSQTRSFQYISDLISAMVRMMELPDFTGPVNIGNPRELTVLELAEKIILFTGSGSRIIHQSLPGDDPRRRQPDITLAKSKLRNWTPVVSLEEGLLKTIDYFRLEVEYEGLLINKKNKMIPAI